MLNVIIKYQVFISRLTLSLAILMVSACSGRQTADADDDTLAVIADSVETLSEQEKTDSLRMPVTTEEILDYMEASEHADRYRAGILPQMARDVAEYASRLIANEHEGFLIVDKATMKIYRYDRFGVLQESMGMACSSKYGTKHKRRDNRTPEGFFTIEGKYDSTDWLFTDDDGNTSDKKGQFGPRFMRLKTPVSSQIGIHGTCAPWSIGGRRSHGCIRVTNENILHLFDIVQTGWPVIVSPGRKDMAVNEEEGYDIPSVAVAPGRHRIALHKETAATPQPETGSEDLADSTALSTEPTIEPAPSPAPLDSIE